MAKYTPPPVDPEFPQRNFVKATFLDKGDKEGWNEYMYGLPPKFDSKGRYIEPKPQEVRKVSGFGQKRDGKLRTSGKGHRIGKR